MPESELGADPIRICTPDWGCASGKFAKPLPTTATRCQRLWRNPHDDDCGDSSAARNDEVADRGGLCALTLWIGRILNIAPRMNSAVLIQ